jgi:two-component system, NtrC family, sensor histidine kinase PilS
MQTEVVPDNYLKSMRLLSVCRVLVAVMISIWVPLAQQGAFRLDLAEESAFFTTSLAYLAVSLGLWVCIRWFSFPYRPQLISSTVTDILFIGLLMSYAGSSRGSLSILLIAPVAAAAVLSTRREAMFFAATATLVLLLEAGWRILGGEDVDVGAFLQAGLVGGAAFLTAFLINQLATRLNQQERIVEQRDLDLREQLLINQRIIAELQEGVLILDDVGEPRAMNGAAEKMLGGMGVRLPTLENGTAPVSWTVPAEGNRAAGKVLLRSVDTGLRTRSAVVFVQDQLEVEQRAQQLKLASMGRLSASIAHEIRNPLSAIRHANALIGETKEVPDTVRRLSAMVESNTVRINRIIEDVLSIARRGSSVLNVSDLPLQHPALFVPEWLREFSEQESAFQNRAVFDSRADSRAIHFDPNHLRQVLVNLVGNALRYSSATAGSVVILWRTNALNDKVGELLVIDDGPGLGLEQRQHLFEPFFSSESTGVGLGLYLARELCVANGAELSYEAFVDGLVDVASHCFVIRTPHVK